MCRCQSNELPAVRHCQLGGWEKTLVLQCDLVSEAGGNKSNPNLISQAAELRTALAEAYEELSRWQQEPRGVGFFWRGVWEV